MLQSVSDLGFVLSWQGWCVLAKEFEYIAANEIMAAVVGNAKNVNDTEGVVFDREAVILDYQVL